MSQNRLTQFCFLVARAWIVAITVIVTINQADARQSASKPNKSLTAGSSKTATPKSGDTDPADSQDTVRPMQPWEKFTPDFIDDDLAGSEQRAWEYRPYKVACWFCLDGSPRANAIYPQAAAEVIRRSELLDASGWDLTIGEAPSKYRRLFLKHIDTPERCLGFTEQQVLNDYDKLMIVCLQDDASQIKASVREFDVQTQQWGPLNHRTIPFGHQAGQQLMDAIAQAFMPLAQIERVTEVEVDVDGKKRTTDEVLMQLRAVQSCIRTQFVRVSSPVAIQSVGETSVATDSTEPNAVQSVDQADAPAQDDQSLDSQTPAAEEAGESGEVGQVTELVFQLAVSPAESSPAFIRSSDLFLPVIRRTDRYKNLLGLEPLQFTFLTVKQQAGAEVRAAIQSRGRAPLSQRKSKRAKKLALVIRPPATPTTLRLVSNEKQPIPMEGFTVLERPVDATNDDLDKVIGQTDWKGEFSVDPSEDGLRVLIIQRGARRLNKLPIVPGLYNVVESPVRNDETRLYAQGVFKGFEKELLGLIIQREIARTTLQRALDKKVAVTAREHLNELRELEELSEIRERLNSAVVDLKSRTRDSKEKTYIKIQHEALLELVKKKILEEQNIHYDPEKKEFGKSYVEQIQILEAKQRRDADAG